MELWEVILEITLCALDAIVASADVYSWFKGRRNRVERRGSRKSGAEIPPRDVWNRRVIVLTALVCLLTLVLIFWRR